MSKSWLFLLIATALSSIAESKADQAGVEVRQYLTGTIPELLYRYPLSTFEIGFSAGVNIAYHGDQGVQAEESGMGYGAGLAIRHFFSNGLFSGLRLDFWRMQIDWMNSQGGAGRSHFILFQPTLEVGKTFEWRSFQITPALSAGAEVNTFVDGASTGQGPVVLLGLAVTLSTSDK
jgi:hypothetical protein